MNMLFLDGPGESHWIARGDRRYLHVLKVLKKREGDWLEAGRSDGALGRAVVESVQAEGIALRFAVEGWAPPPLPLRILLGFPRPIQAGRILKDLTSLGVSSIWFFLSELGEKSYAESRFFREGQFRGHLVEGAEQSGDPRLPEIRTFWSLARALDELGPEPSPRGTGRLCLQPGRDLPPLSSLPGLEPPLALALGSERGWTQGELSALSERGFVLCRLGGRILKTETAATVAAALALSRCGLL